MCYDWKGGISNSPFRQSWFLRNQPNKRSWVPLPGPPPRLLYGSWVSSITPHWCFFHGESKPRTQLLIQQKVSKINSYLCLLKLVATSELWSPPLINSAPDINHITLKLAACMLVDFVLFHCLVLRLRKPKFYYYIYKTCLELNNH